MSNNNFGNTIRLAAPNSAATFPNGIDIPPPIPEPEFSDVIQLTKQGWQVKRRASDNIGGNPPNNQHQHQPTHWAPQNCKQPNQQITYIVHPVQTRSQSSLRLEPTKSRHTWPTRTALPHTASLPDGSNEVGKGGESRGHNPWPQCRLPPSLRPQHRLPPSLRPQHRNPHQPCMQCHGYHAQQNFAYNF